MVDKLSYHALSRAAPALDQPGRHLKLRRCATTDPTMRHGFTHGNSRIPPGGPADTHAALVDAAFGGADRFPRVHDECHPSRRVAARRPSVR